MKRIAVFSNGELMPLIAPVERPYDLGFLIPDYHLTWEHNGQYFTHVSRVRRNEIMQGRPIYIKGSDPKVLMPGLPPTVQFVGQGRVQLTGAPAGELWQEAVFEAAPAGMSDTTKLKRYKGITADGVCFTDFTGGDAYNPVMNSSNPIYLLGDKKDIGGEPHLSFRLLKVGTKSYMKGQIAEWPFLKMKANVSTRAHNEQGVDPWAQLDGRDVPYFPFGKTSEMGWVAEWRVWKLSRSEPIPSTYYPPR